MQPLYDPEAVKPREKESLKSQGPHTKQEIGIYLSLGEAGSMWLPNKCLINLVARNQTNIQRSVGHH